MSARSDAYRGDGLHFPVFAPAAGNFGPVVVPDDMRLRHVTVKAGGAATVVTVKVNGVAQTIFPAGGAVGAGATQTFDVSNPLVIPQGATLEVDTSDAGALISLSFTRA